MKEVAGGNFRVHVETKSVFRDIRDSFDSFNLMVSELNATETLQTDFISNVSHEFKTPISAIEGYASLLQEHQQSPEEQAEYIDKILFNTRRLSALAGNILLLSKLDSQSIHPQRSRFRLDEQVRQCILALERKWTEKDVDFDVDLDSVDFTGYEGLLQHVWTNLIDNAVKFGPRGGLIRMRLIEEDGSVLFTIDNEGKSIPGEDKSRIFNKFYQGDSSHESEGNGPRPCACAQDRRHPRRRGLGRRPGEWRLPLRRAPAGREVTTIFQQKLRFSSSFVRNSMLY